MQNSRTTENAQFDQKGLLVTRNIEQHQEICSRIPEMSTEQILIYKEDRRTLFIRNTSRIMVGNKYKYHNITFKTRM